MTRAAPGSALQAPPLWERLTPEPGSRLAQLLTGLPSARVFEADGGRLRAIVSHDDDRWHVSVSHTDRYPTWDEVADARYRFVPDRVTMAMLMPPRAQWINVHETTLQLWEVRTGLREGQVTP